MSGAIGNGFGIMSTLLRGVDKLNAQNDALTAELSSGVVSDSFAGLGDQAYEAISLQPQISATNAWQANVTQTQTRLQATQNALTSITSIAGSLQSTLLSLQGDASTEAISTASTQARQQLTQLTSLLNTQSGGSYVFAGTASDQAPVGVSDLASSTLVSGIASAVSQVASTGAAATEAATLAAASDNGAANSVFSAQLSTTAEAARELVPQVQVGHDQFAAAGIVATQGGAAGPTSTGSAIRDLIRSLATVAGLSGAGGGDGLQSLIADTSSQMSGVTQGLAGLTAVVGVLQDASASASSNLSDMSDALQSQLGATKDSDPTTTRTQQVAVQNQLTASYTLIADMKTLDLAQYL